MMLSMSLRNLPRFYKTRKAVTLLLLKLIMGVSSKMKRFEKFCEKIGIKNPFLAPRTP